MIVNREPGQHDGEQFPIYVAGVHKSYRSGPVTTPVLNGVDLAVRRGTCIYLAGPSGSGKTTLLSILGCLLSADRGVVRILGRDVAGLPPGPISNPGEAALVAALAPSDCTDLYFVSKNDGSHVFCPDLRCHQSAVQEWQVRFFRARRAARESAGAPPEPPPRG